MQKFPPLSLYVHVPWCVQKCPYCDFNSHAQKGTIPEQEYVQHLIADLEADLKKYQTSIQNRSLHSIFIGGGTPSLFSAKSIKLLLAEIKRRRCRQSYSSADYGQRPIGGHSVQRRPGYMEQAA